MTIPLDPLTPTERVVIRRRRIKWLIILLIIAWLVWRLVFANQYVVAFADPREHFKHGSIGAETASGLPTLVFKALPMLYEKRLGPGGWQRFGFLYAPGDDIPLGMSRRVVSGVERVWFTCSVCHISSYRLPGESERHLVLGGPSNTLQLYPLIRFLIDVGRDPGFNADTLLAAIDSKEVGGDLNLLQRAVYRYIVYPRVKQALLDLGRQLAFVERQQDWGPGRVDTFNPYKAIQFNFPMGPADVSAVALDASSDFPSLWMQRPREGMQLHWDGNNTSVAERNLSAALGAGVTPVTVDRAAIGRIEDWMLDLPPPEFPGLASLDPASVQRGAEVYGAYCAACHGLKAGGRYDYSMSRYPRLGRVTRLADVGTDPGRWASYTPNFAAAQNLLYAGYPWRFTHFSKTAGYANQPLDGIWARAPYLHNGSVPTLSDLLEPAAKRPRVWYRGNEEYDPVHVGYQWAAAAPGLFRYDTARAGNGNGGHSGPAYGTELPAADKQALLDYMKTL